MVRQEEIIRKYFSAWINNDVNTVRTVLSDHIIYIECYGPKYSGINQVVAWFLDWHQCGAVRKWDIKQFLHQKNTTVVEWYFECSYNGSVDGFDGVSLVEFDDNGKIISIKEFQSKTEHYYPYG